MGSSQESARTVLPHRFRWGALQWAVLASAVCVLAAIGLVTKGSSAVSLGSGSGLFFPSVAAGLTAASVAVLSLALKLRPTVFLVARAIVVLSAIAVIIAPPFGVVQQAGRTAGSPMILQWLLAVGLAVIAVALFTLDRKGRPNNAELTRWFCLVGLSLPVAKLVDDLFSLLPGDTHGFYTEISTTSAVAFLCLLITVLALVSRQSIEERDERFRRILRLRSVAIAVALAFPVAVQVVRFLVADVDDTARYSTDLVLALLLMAGSSAVVWFGFSAFMKREALVLETRSRLEVSKFRYTSALKNAKLGAWELNVQTNELHWSEELAPLFGYEHGELETTNENFLGAVHPEDRQRVIDSVNACIYEGAVYDIEHRVVWPDGTVRWMHERGYAERNDDGVPFRMFGIVEDVTDSKKAQVHLAESVERYETIVSNVPGAVYCIEVVGDSSRFTYLSPAFKSIFGLDPQAAMNDFQSYLETIHPEDRGDTLEAIVSASRIGSVTWEGRIVVDGKIKWIESRSTHKRQPDGSIRIDGIAFDITEKVETQRLLSASEERFERMAENAPGMVYQIHHATDGTVTMQYVSPGVEEVYGLTVDEVTADPGLLIDCIHEDDREDNLQVVADSARRLESFQWTGRILKRSGEQRYIQVTSRPIALEDGSILWDGMMVDVTVQKQAEEDLKVARDRLADLLSSSPAVIYACETESPYALTFISENVVDHFGFSEAECLSRGTFLADRTHPDDIETALAALDSIEETGQCVLEYRIKNSSGEYRWILDEIRLVVRADKREIVGTLLDITERKLAEEALRLSDERFRAMSGASPLGIFMSDKHGGIVYVNSKLTEVLRVGQEKLYGDGWQNFVHFEDRDRLKTILMKSTSLETPYSLECRLIRSDNAVIWCGMKAAPMFDHGSLVGFVGTVEDITDRRELEIETEQARIDSERANQAKSEFLSRMSHELRTPLNAILGYAQLLEMDSDHADAEPIGQILKGGRHLLSLINEVLDIARIESGDIGIELEPIRLKPVVDEVAELLRPIAHERAVALDVKIDVDDMTYVLADPQRLKQVVLNVTSNAVKYNKPEGFVTIMIEHVNDSTVELVVRDTGKGIPSDKLFRLFTPFDRLGAESTQVAGSGLGLALTHRLMTAMNGRIEIESEEGVGTQARIVLRLSENPELRLPPLKDLSLGHVDTFEKPARILLIEDNEANIRLMETIFSRKSHYTLDVAMTGSLGIDLAQKHRPDLILLDVNLPDSIGTSVIERIKSDPILKDTDVIVISADANKKQIERFRKAGAVAYLTKPVNVGELMRLVEGVLDTV